MDIGLKNKLRKFYTRLDPLQILERDRATWVYLRDTLNLEVAQWTNNELDQAEASADGYLGIKKEYKCYIKNE